MVEALQTLIDFNPRPPWGGRHCLTYRGGRVSDFNPRPPWGGRPLTRWRLLVKSTYFNPRPPWGGRLFGCRIAADNALFQSTPSVGRATCRQDGQDRGQAISIHALRGEGDIETVMSDSRYVISIHALRGEGDEDLSDTVRRLRISIHALRGEGDGLTKTVRQSSARFQSTPSVGRAT